MPIQKNKSISRVLVVGPNGNIGKVLIPRLLELGYTVRALQYRTPVEPRSGLEVVQGHTLDADAVRHAVDGVDAVCHMIRATGPGDTPCEKWFNCCLRGTVNLLEAAREVNLQRFVNGSADNVFGHITMAHIGPINETHPKRFADDYYGLFKILEEELLRQYHIGYGVPTVVTRFALIWREASLERCAGALDRERKVIQMRLDRDGRPHVRHDVHISDAVAGILLALEKDQAVGRDFTFASPTAYSSEQMASLLHDILGWPIEKVESDWYSWTLDDSKARSVLGYCPQVNVLDYVSESLRAS